LTACLNLLAPVDATFDLADERLVVLEGEGADESIEEAEDSDDVSEPESELWDEFESGTARYSCEVWSDMEVVGGNGGGEIEAGF
jgi:hypothetical protein